MVIDNITQYHRAETKCYFVRFYRIAEVNDCGMVEERVGTHVEVHVEPCANKRRGSTVAVYNTRGRAAGHGDKGDR